MDDEKLKLLLLGLRQALLMAVDAVERYLDFPERTSDLRKKAKATL